jgi:hypothetical protein
LLLRQPFPNVSAPRLHKWYGIFSVRLKRLADNGINSPGSKASKDLEGRRVVAQVVEPKTFRSGHHWVSGTC